MKTHIAPNARQNTGMRIIIKTFPAFAVALLAFLAVSTNIRADNITVITAAAGSKHSLYLTSEGKLWMMGNYSDSPDMRNTSVQVADDVVTLASGNDHSLFITRDGKLWAMENNACGQLGDGTTTTRDTPVHVNTADVSVKAVSVGNNHSLFVTSDGELWAMGANFYGQLGRDDIASETHEPVLIVQDGIAVEAQSHGGKKPGSPQVLAAKDPSYEVSNANLVVSFSIHPRSQTVKLGDKVTFSVSVTGTPPFKYQWYYRPATGPYAGTWIKSYGYSGSTSKTLTLGAAGTPDNKKQFYCAVSNAYGSKNSNVATLTVTSASGGGGGGGGSGGDNSSGGGGAPSFWLLAAIGMLAALRLRRHYVSR